MNLTYKKSFLFKVFSKLRENAELTYIASNFSNEVIKDREPVVFLAVLSCHKNKEQREACRKTWLSNLPNNISYKFFLGRSEVEYEEEEDCIYLDVDDDYNHLPEKAIAAAFYSTQFEYDWYGKCDDDTYLHLERLPELLFEKECDAIGKLSFDEKWALGGAGYFWKRNIINAFEYAINESLIQKLSIGLEDRILGCRVTDFGYKWENSDLLCQFFDKGNDNLISLHKVQPNEMIELHKQEQES